MDHVAELDETTQLVPTARVGVAVSRSSQTEADERAGPVRVFGGTPAGAAEAVPATAATRVGREDSTTRAPGPSPTAETRVGAPDLAPGFAVVLRGYDRSQVEAYIAEERGRRRRAEMQAAASVRQLADAQSHVEELRSRVQALEVQEFSTPPASIEAIGRRVGRILDEAWAAAEELQADARRQADEAQGRAEAIIAEAEAVARRRAADLVEEAETRRQTVLQELQDEERRYRQELERFQGRRDLARSQLGELQAALQRALATDEGTPSAPAADELPSPVAPDEQPTYLDEDAPTRALPALGQVSAPPG